MCSATDMETKYICPNCGGDMEPSPNQSDETYICNDCGCCVSTNELYNVDTDHICPNCNQPLEGNECSYCGYDLGSDFE
jgi:DNA-directed RNA polymerase subunit RPC12/RpoP